VAGTASGHKFPRKYAELPRSALPRDRPKKRRYRPFLVIRTFVPKVTVTGYSVLPRKVKHRRRFGPSSRARMTGAAFMEFGLASMT
jgi:hypothetical protein